MTKSHPADPPARAFRSGRVAIVGRPNVGKSTLLNALVGARISITSSKPQTTRGHVAGILTTGEEQFVFVDTPGFQLAHRSRLNDRMNRTVRDTLSDVDAIVLVLEGTRFGPADREVVGLLPEGVPVVVAINKVDRVDDKSRLLPFLQELARKREFAALIPVSAEKKWQLKELVDEVRKHLPEGPPLYGADDVTDRDERFLAAEFVREKIFRLLGEEVPYATSVGIESFVLDGDLRRISAIIYVERANQRAILLGKDGERMKAIASESRRDMERLFGGKVFLEVWVKVKSGWSNDERTLTRFGY